MEPEENLEDETLEEQGGGPILILHEVLEVRATEDPDTYIAKVDLTDITGERYETDYVSRPGDSFGLAPTVRDAIAQWISDGKPVAPYVPPTPEAIRAAMPALTRRQLRLGLLQNNISTTAIEAAIDAIEDEMEREAARIEWEDATQYLRTHPLMSRIGAALSLTDEQIDTMWMAAVSL